MSGVNVRNLEKIQDKWLLFQRFVTSIVGSENENNIFLLLLPFPRFSAQEHDKEISFRTQSVSPSLFFDN